MRKVVPFAGEGAQAGGVLARRFPDQKIGKVEKAPGLIPGFRMMSLQPQQFWQFHFNTHLAAHVAQGRIACGIDANGFFVSTMIHPHNDVLRCRTVGGHAQAVTLSIQRDQRAGGVEANRTNGVG